MERNLATKSSFYYQVFFCFDEITNGFKNNEKKD